MKKGRFDLGDVNFLGNLFLWVFKKYLRQNSLYSNFLERYHISLP